MMPATFRTLGRALLLLFLLLFGMALLPPLAAEELTAEQGIFLDLPAGFTPGEGDGRTRFSYFSPDGEVEFILRIEAPESRSTVEKWAQETLAKLGSQGKSASFRYEGREAVLAELSFTLGSSPRMGYALFLREASGGGYALLAHAEVSESDAAGELIISCLDSFSIDRAARRLPGPVSQFLLAWPPPRPDRKTVMLPGGRAELPWSEEEAEQEQYTVEREYRILTTHLADQVHWKDAWARFYRMVYRESASRLDGLTEAVARTLPRDDPAESARKVLAWVQGFVFERDPSGMDFVPPLAAAFERRGDCDSRVLVMALILERLGIDCVLMLSREYSHAMLAVGVPGGGQRFPFGGREYLVAETTAGVGLGMIDASQTDLSKWIGVDVGE